MIFNMVTRNGAKKPSDVTFYDYDGTIIESYRAADFANLTAMPSNPTHEGLTAQGWNWTLADAKAYVATYGGLDIGQMYITASGKTEIDITLETGRTDPYLGICPNGTVEVDWGDNTTDTVTGSSTSTVVFTQHTYASAGDYTIKLDVTSGTCAIASDSQFSKLLSISTSNTNANKNFVYLSAIRRVRLGKDMEIGNYAFKNCEQLLDINFTNSLTSIGNYAFQGCYNLKGVVIPNTTATVGSYAFAGCNSLLRVTLSKSITDLEASAFNGCSALKRIALPDDITTLGTSICNGCKALAEAIAPSISQSIFNNCSGLTKVTIGNATSIPQYAFTSCDSLQSVTIPSGVTEFITGAFTNCFSLTSITIPSGVTSIMATVFGNCYGMKEYHILPTTPPTLGNVSAFSNIPSDCIIYVPSASLTAYQTANKWSTYASQMVGE